MFSWDDYNSAAGACGASGCLAQSGGWPRLAAAKFARPLNSQFSEVHPMTHYAKKSWPILSLGLLAVSLAGWTALADWTGLATSANADSGAAKMLVHDVYFTLNDNSSEAREKLVAACEKYLTDHPGTVFFAAGTVADLDRSVNQRDWDIGLHVVFKDRKAHDDYQEAPRHKQFIEENRSNWKVVRVFDTDVRGSTGR
jgi:hypothetical protein